MSNRVAVTKIISSLAFLVAAFPISERVAAAQDPKREPNEQTHLINSLEGRALYQSYCASCHGENGTGNGPMAGVLKNAVPDLTQIAVRNSGVFSLPKVEKIISGESELMAHGPRQMPLWGPIFSQIAWDQDLGRIRVNNLAKYLQSIQKPAPVGIPRR